ncbi:hypothetical protein MHYP_G00301670 [Metynnis hypsauchen]
MELTRRPATLTRSDQSSSTQISSRRGETGRENLNCGSSKLLLSSCFDAQLIPGIPGIAGIVSRSVINNHAPGARARDPGICSRAGDARTGLQPEALWTLLAFCIEVSDHRCHLFSWP